MDEKQGIESLIRSPERFLLIDTDNDESRLVRRSDITPSPLAIAVDLRQAYHNFTDLAGDRDDFLIEEMVVIAGISRGVMRWWIQDGITRPAGQRPPVGRGHRPNYFTFTEAFLVGIAGSLRRAKFPPPTIAKVTSFLRERISMERDKAKLGKPAGAVAHGREAG